MLAGLGLALVLARRWRWRREPVDGQNDLDAFWAGAGIFCATFALFQNYDYRLIFLLLTVPQLLRWTRDISPRVPSAGWALAGVAATLWLGMRLPIFPLELGELWVRAAGWFPYEEIVNWLLFAYFAAALALTAGSSKAIRAGTAR